MFEHSPSARTPERCRTTSYDCVALKLYKNKITQTKNPERRQRKRAGLAGRAVLSLSLVECRR